MRKNLFKFFCFAIISFLVSLSGCRQNEVYYKFAEIKNSEWRQRDTLYFVIDSMSVQSGVPYKVNIELAHNASYPYRNIWMYFEDNFNDTIPLIYSCEYILADSFGKWYGSGFGALYQLSFVYKDSVYFNNNGNLLLKVVQGMRDEPLTGIEKIGVRIERN